MDKQLLDSLKQGWWLLLIRGIAAIVFGLLAFFMPGLTLVFLLIAFAAFTLVDGVFAMITAFRRRSQDTRWWAWLLEGLLSVGVGVIVLLFPALSAVAFAICIAVWAVFAGILRIIAAINLRHQIEGEWALGISGALLILWGILMGLMPGVGALSLAWMIGSFSILIGIAFCILAFRLRKLD